MRVFRPSELHLFLESIGVKAKRSLSQNFLIDGNIIAKIIQVSELKPTDLVVEIGPGPGALTQALLDKGCRVIAIEKDRLFAQALHQLQTEDRRLEVYAEDILKFPLDTFLAGKLKEGQKAIVISNLPYQITAPLLSLLVPMYEKISSLTLMVQKEVADRITASKNTSEYGHLTLFLEYYCDAEYNFTVEPTCFYPRPKIRSAVITITPKKPKPLSSVDHFFKMTRGAFQQRRKMLRSSLKSLYASQKVQDALKDLHFLPTARPEDLSLNEFILLFDLLSASSQSDKSINSA